MSLITCKIAFTKSLHQKRIAITGKKTILALVFSGIVTALPAYSIARTFTDVAITVTGKVTNEKNEPSA